MGNHEVDLTRCREGALYISQEFFSEWDEAYECAEHLTKTTGVDHYADLKIVNISDGSPLVVNQFQYWIRKKSSEEKPKVEVEVEDKCEGVEYTDRLGLGINVCLDSNRSLIDAFGLLFATLFDPDGWHSDNRSSFDKQDNFGDRVY